MIRRPSFFIGFASLAVMITACSRQTSRTSNPKQIPHASAPSHGAWDYSAANGPEHWAALDKSFSACANGRLQSPIDLPSTAIISDTLFELQFSYPVLSNTSIVNNGHTIQVNAGNAGTLRRGEKSWELLQFHFHSPSEHMIAGQRFPLEAHFVHKDKAGHLAVVAVLFQLGAKHPTLSSLWSLAPTGEGESPLARFDVNSLLPTDRAYYAYPGSLTTPPCSEGVAWHVLVAPLELSSDQLDAFQKLYSGNARGVMPLGERVIRRSPLQR